MLGKIPLLGKFLAWLRGGGKWNFTVIFGNHNSVRQATEDGPPPVPRQPGNAEMPSLPAPEPEPPQQVPISSPRNEPQTPNGHWDEDVDVRVLVVTIEPDERAVPPPSAGSIPPAMPYKSRVPVPSRHYLDIMGIIRTSLSNGKWQRASSHIPINDGWNIQGYADPATHSVFVLLARAESACDVSVRLFEVPEDWGDLAYFSNWSDEGEWRRLAETVAASLTSGGRGLECIDEFSVDLDASNAREFITSRLDKFRV